MFNLVYIPRQTGNRVTGAMLQNYFEGRGGLWKCDKFSLDMLITLATGAEKKVELKLAE